MSWQTRRNGRCYYYREFRQGQRIVKQYAGSKMRGALAAEQDAAARRTRRQHLQHRRDQRRLVQELGQRLDTFAQLTRPLLIAELLSAGWNLRNREWSLPPCLNKK